MFFTPYPGNPIMYPLFFEYIGKWYTIFLGCNLMPCVEVVHPTYTSWKVQWSFDHPRGGVFKLGDQLSIFYRSYGVNPNGWQQVSQSTNGKFDGEQDGVWVWWPPIKEINVLDLKVKPTFFNCLYLPGPLLQGVAFDSPSYSNWWCIPSWATFWVHYVGTWSYARATSALRIPIPCDFPLHMVQFNL